MVLDFFGVQSLLKLQKDIDALSCWSKQWLLLFNITKRKLLHTGRERF